LDVIIDSSYVLLHMYNKTREDKRSTIENSNFI